MSRSSPVLSQSDIIQKTIDSVRNRRKYCEQFRRAMDTAQDTINELQDGIGKLDQARDSRKIMKMVATIGEQTQNISNARHEVDPTKEFNKIFESLIGVKEKRYSKSLADTYGVMRQVFLERAEDSEVTPEEKKELQKDLYHLDRSYNSFLMKDWYPGGKSSLIAKHSLEGINAMLNGEYKGKGTQYSATLVWSGPEDHHNTPCFLYADKNNKDISFGVVYDSNKVDISQGEFFAHSTFGKTGEEYKSKIGSKYSFDNNDGKGEYSISLKSKYPAKQGVMRKVKSKDGKLENFFVTDYSRWHSRTKTWHGDESAPEKRLEVYADNIWWRYRRHAPEKHEESFATKAEFQFQTKIANKERGAKRLGTEGLAQYNEALIAPKSGVDYSQTPRVIFVNISNSDVISVDQINSLIDILDNNKHLRFGVYNNKNRTDILQEYNGKLAIAGLRALKKQTSTKESGQASVSDKFLNYINKESQRMGEIYMQKIESLASSNKWIECSQGKHLYVMASDEPSREGIKATYEVFINNPESSFKISRRNDGSYCSIDERGYEKDVFTPSSTTTNDHILSDAIGDLVHRSRSVKATSASPSATISSSRDSVSSRGAHVPPKKRKPIKDKLEEIQKHVPVKLDNGDVVSLTKEDGKYRLTKINLDSGDQETYLLKPGVSGIYAENGQGVTSTIAHDAKILIQDTLRAVSGLKTPSSTQSAVRSSYPPPPPRQTLPPPPPSSSTPRAVRSSYPPPPPSIRLRNERAQQLSQQNTKGAVAENP